MPLYDYHCDDCGDFRAWQSMSKSSSDVACPSCTQSASRRVTAPSLALMPANNRIAHTRNEKSADHPVVATRATMDEGRAKNDHAHCSHGHQHGKGSLSHSHGRPWMIGH
ncbi:MAG: zinc ribbon domain-containing protein [Rhodospirillaceae bacterium]|nr:zinc ribbon domain-containing protein [Rhodospirillaceae bacterium]